MMFRRKCLRRLAALLMACCLVSAPLAQAAEISALDEAGETGSTIPMEEEQAVELPAPDKAGETDPALPVEEEQGEAELFSDVSDYGFYIDEYCYPDGSKANVLDPDNKHTFVFGDHGDHWTYTYNRNDTEFPYTLTLHDGFNHEFAIFNNTNTSEGRKFKIVVEGSATISNWEMTMEMEEEFFAAYPVYVYGGSLTIEKFSSIGGSELTCALVASQGDISIPTSVQLVSGGSLWAQGGTITVQGNGKDPAVEGWGAAQLFCYVDDRYPASYICIDGRGQPAVRFHVNNKYAETPSEDGTRISTGFELENTKLVGASDERLYIGSENIGVLSVYDEQGRQAAYLKATNDGTAVALPDKNKPLTVTFSNGQEEFFEAAATAKMLPLPAFTMSAPLGKVFDGWSINGVQIPLSYGNDPNMYWWMFVTDTTVQAVWKDARPTEVRCNPNDGGYSSGSWLTTVNGKLPYLPYPARDGCDFIGWFTEADGGTEVTLETEFWSGESVTIFAHWQERTGTAGTFYGTGVSWAQTGSSLQLTGSGAVPENLSRAPWSPFREASTVTTVSIGADIISIPENLFSSDIELEEIRVDAANPSLCSVDGTLYNKGQTRLIQYPRNAAGTSLTLPASVESIAPNALVYSRNLTEVHVASGNSAYYSQDGVLFAFGGQSRSAGQGGTLCFYPRARTQTSYAVPSGTEVIGSNAFYGSHLVRITLPDGLTEISGSAFYDNRNLEKINLPEGLQSIGGEAFRFCGKLQEAALPEGLLSIGNYGFYDCASLKRIDFPATMQTVGHDAFENCTALEGIVIPDKLKISSDALKGCVNLKYAVFGKNTNGVENVFGGSAPALTTLVMSTGARIDKGAEFSTSFPNLERLYLCGRDSFWKDRVKDWVIPESVDVKIGPWHDLIETEDRGQTTRVYVYNNLVQFSYPYPLDYLSSDTIILAAYDAAGRLLNAQVQADLRETGLLTFDLPIPRDKCARFAVYAVKADGSYVPITAKAE